MEVTHKPLSRGVYWAAATKNGKPEVFATNAAGDEVKRMTLHDYSWKRAEAAIEFLWRFLDMTDPAIELGRTTPVLVLPEPSRAVRSDIYDPYAESGVPGHLREPW